MVEINTYNMRKEEKGGYRRVVERTHYQVEKQFPRGDL